MSALKIGYARCSTGAQDLAAQRKGLAELGVPADRIYTDHGLTGANRDRPGLAEALAALREGDTFVVAKLDRLGRSVPDLRDISAEILAKGAKLQIGATVHDPTDAVGKLLFNALAMVAEFEHDIMRQRTREGLEIAREKGKLRGRKPKLTPAQEKHLVDLVRGGQHTSAEVAELCGVSRATVHRTMQRAGAAAG